VDHEPFIDSLIRQNAELLGGKFEDAAARHKRGVCLALRQPCRGTRSRRVRSACGSGPAKPIVTKWDLVGVNTAAIEEDLIIGPSNV
jgi:hypothetical protein